VSKYRIGFATHWHFDPRQVDTFYITEFDHFAEQADAIERENAKQQAEQEKQTRQINARRGR